jgi:uncharacterized tellurite resistance protein B-like protein
MTDFSSGMKTLVRCMIVIASADDQLHEREIEVITTVYQNLMGQPIDRTLVKELFEQMRRDAQAWLFDDAAAFETLDMETKKLIAKACYMVMVSDREVTEEELETLAAIAAALHLSEDQFVEIVREVSPGRSHR